MMVCNTSPGCVDRAAFQQCVSRLEGNPIVERYFGGPGQGALVFCNLPLYRGEIPVGTGEWSNDRMREKVLQAMENNTFMRAYSDEDICVFQTKSTQEKIRGIDWLFWGRRERQPNVHALYLATLKYGSFLEPNPYHGSAKAIDLMGDGRCRKYGCLDVGVRANLDKFWTGGFTVWYGAHTDIYTLYPNNTPPAPLYDSIERVPLTFEDIIPH